MAQPVTSQHEADSSALGRGVLRLARRLRTERQDNGLGINALGVLTHLYLQGAMTPGAIAAAEQQQPQSLTRVFADLERAGLILRQKSETDQRQHVLKITAAGRGTVQQDLKSRDAWLAAALAELNPTERQVLSLAATLMNQLASRR
ncbi:MAG: MarR family transcriptional regulator [Casimicrobium sp.]